MEFLKDRLRKLVPRVRIPFFRQLIQLFYLLKQLVQFANSKSLMSKNLSSVSNLQKQLTNIDILTIISGDNGAFKELPRLTCHIYKNIKFITNGIGDIKEDKILVINKNTIYSYNLK